MGNMTLDVPNVLSHIIIWKEKIGGMVFLVKIPTKLNAKTVWDEQHMERSTRFYCNHVLCNLSLHETHLDSSWKTSRLSIMLVFLDACKMNVLER